MNCNSLESDFSRKFIHCKIVGHKCYGLMKLKVIHTHFNLCLLKTIAPFALGANLGNIKRLLCMTQLIPKFCSICNVYESSPQPQQFYIWAFGCMLSNRLYGFATGSIFTLKCKGWKSMETIFALFFCSWMNSATKSSQQRNYFKLIWRHPAKCSCT